MCTAPLSSSWNWRYINNLHTYISKHFIAGRMNTLSKKQKKCTFGIRPSPRNLQRIYKSTKLSRAVARNGMLLQSVRIEKVSWEVMLDCHLGG